MPITVDCHIHSRNSCDSACMKVSDLLGRARQKGILDLCLTDHVHTPFNLPDLAASRREYLANEPSPRFHFGVEVSVVSEWELRELASGKYDRPVYGLRTGGPPGAPLAIGLGEQDLVAHDVEYVVGGAHWPMYVEIERETVIRDYHRQNMFLAMHPLVDIVAHPWWWMKYWQDPDGMFRTDPWFDDFRRIPPSMHDEFAAAAVQHGAMVEINLAAILLNPHYTEKFRRQYVEYLAYLKSRSVILTIGSDCHTAQYDIDFETADRMLAGVGIRDEDLWRPPPRKVS